MSVLINSISATLILLLLAIPILILRFLNKRKIGFKFIVYLIISLFLSALTVLTFAWWSNFSDQLLMAHLGYNIDGMNKQEFYKNVSPENLQTVKNLEISLFGIGWPLKALSGFLVFIPYLLIVYLVGLFLKRK